MPTPGFVSVSVVTFKPIFTVNTLPALKSIVVVAVAVIALGMVSLNLFAVISPDTTTDVAVAAPNTGVTKLGLVERTIFPEPVEAAVPKTPAAELVTIPATFNPVIVAPLKLGEADVATDCPIEIVLPPDKVTPVPTAIVVCFSLNKFQSADVK